MKLLQDRTPLSHLFQAQSELTPLTKEICFGVCRHYFRLQALADCLVDKRPKTVDVWLVLLIGLYQLHFMQKPDYAVVKETVALLDPLKNPGQRDWLMQF
nr:transcription antitermination factor NusB [Legionella tunisiensis]